VLGVDGLIGGVQRLTHIYVPSRPAPAPAATPAEAAPDATTMQPGVVPAFVVPAEPAPDTTSARSGSGSSGR
jgi:hypothetical protein